MKKLLIGVMVCLTASMAMASVPAAFNLVPDVIVLNGDTGDATDVLIQASGAGTIAGMSLYLEASAPISIDTLAIDNVGGVFTAPGTSTGATIYTYALTPEVVPVAQLAVGYVTTSAATMAVADGALLAKLHISIPAGTPRGLVGWITTNSPSMGFPSDFVDPTGQDTVMVQIIPEPVTALLLVLGLPFLRRRVA